MGDMGDMYREHREYRRQKKARYQDHNLPGDLALLDRLTGVTYEIKNGGEHYVLTVRTDRGERRVNYWPSTGYWRVEQGKGCGHRVQQLKAYFRLKEEGA